MFEGSTTILAAQASVSTDNFDKLYKRVTRSRDALYKQSLESMPWGWFDKIWYRDKLEKFYRISIIKLVMKGNGYMEPYLSFRNSEEVVFTDYLIPKHSTCRTIKHLCGLNPQGYITVSPVQLSFIKEFERVR